ncbi:MAG: hypothetical protein NW207_02350 [Cytophagales bacterium]|nr:hypothetical protein [Cytophagales bacterium]
MEATLQYEKQTINWNQIYSLVALNGAVVISWIAYHNYQPKVLEIFKFQELAFFLVVAQAVILVCIPPVAGIIGDFVIKSNGNRFIVFTVGTSVTAMVFMAVAFTVGTSSTINFTAALPFMIVIWLISMNIFHSPANSMLELFAPAKELPQAMALMTMTTELIYALEPIVVWFVDSIGAVLTFVTGGVLLIVTGYFFRKTTTNLELSREYEETKSTVKNNFPLVLTVGIALGLATAIIMKAFPSLLSVKLAAYDQQMWGGAHFISIILAVSALCAWPASQWINKIGVSNSLIYGTISTFAFMGLVYVMPNDILTMIACLGVAASYSVMNVAAFPFALYNLSPKMVTFGAGIFFGSLELASGLMEIFQGMK